MAASALFILDLKGRVILSRDYRGDVAPKLVERFISRVNELEDTGEAGNHDRFERAAARELAGRPEPSGPA